MLYEDNETNLLEDFRLRFNSAALFGEPVAFFPDSAEIQGIVASLTKEELWRNEWIDSSSKDAPPPDFYNDKRKVMMEVMRVDDHAFEKDGKIINPTAQLTRTREKEASRKLGLPPNSNVPIHIIAATDLPTEEDHNYRFYIDNFKRIIEKHKEKIPQYKQNHPDYELIFFIFDESSLYFQSDTLVQTIMKGEFASGMLHLWFRDKNFVNVFMNSGIDYLIWFAPYKYAEKSEPPLVVPSICVFDCNQTSFKCIEYAEAYMTSAEV